MRFLPPDDDIELYVQGFEEDLLNRVRVGKALSSLLERIEDPLVVALDGRWGTGKSHFLKRWVGAHSNQNEGSATTVYFDAFANDYLDDPLIALVATLADRMPPAKKSEVDRVKSLALRFFKPVARIGLSVATFGATEALNDLGDAVTGAASDEARRALDAFWQREEGRTTAMEQFRTSITTLISSGAGAHEKISPLVIVIDELDRCRPDYALQVLELIKHFFAVPRVHFVLGANLSALENSVKVRYGGEIDATAYLHKFISFTFSLPDTIGDQDRTPSVVAYIMHLGGRMGTPQHVLNALIAHLRIVSRTTPVSIRDVGKIMSSLALLPDRVVKQRMGDGWLEVLTTLAVAKMVRPDLYPKFRDATINQEEIARYYGADAQSNMEMIDGKYNQYFNRDLTLRYYCWLYIASDGNYSEAREEVRHHFSAEHDFGGSPSTIPEYVHLEWLDLFKTA